MQCVSLTIEYHSGVLLKIAVFYTKAHPVCTHFYCFCVMEIIFGLASVI